MWSHHRVEGCSSWLETTFLSLVWAQDKAHKFAHAVPCYENKNVQMKQTFFLMETGMETTRRATRWGVLIVANWHLEHRRSCLCVGSLGKLNLESPMYIPSSRTAIPLCDKYVRVSYLPNLMVSKMQTNRRAILATPGRCCLCSCVSDCTGSTYMGIQ